MSNSKIVNKNHVESKTFTYNKGSTNLNFTLRLDIKSQMKDFTELLEQALVDVNEEINRKFPRHEKS